MAETRSQPGLIQVLHGLTAVYATSFRQRRGSLCPYPPEIQRQRQPAAHCRGRRRAHGLAQNSIQAALLLACSGIRKVRSFLNEAVPDAKGILYKPVPNTRQRTPGSPGTETVTD